MTDENKTVEEKQTTCFCQSKGFKKFLIITGGTFVGVFLALSLFAALHKPPMPPMPMNPYAFGPGPQMVRPCNCHHHHHFDRGHRGDFHKKMMKNRCDRPLPPRADRNLADD